MLNSMYNCDDEWIFGFSMTMEWTRRSESRDLTVSSENYQIYKIRASHTGVSQRSGGNRVLFFYRSEPIWLGGIRRHRSVDRWAFCTDAFTPLCNIYSETYWDCVNGIYVEIFHKNISNRKYCTDSIIYFSFTKNVLSLQWHKNVEFPRSGPTELATADTD